MRVVTVRRLIGACTLICLGMLAQLARAQSFRYEPESRAGGDSFLFSDAEPPPRMNGQQQSRPTQTGRTSPNAIARGLQRPVSTVAWQQEARTTQDARTTRVRSGEFLQTARTSQASPSQQMLDPFAEDIPAGQLMPARNTSSGEIIYEGQPSSEMMLDPIPMGESYSPEAEYNSYYLDDTYEYAGEYGGDPYARGGLFFLRRWWRHVGCLYQNGAYCENMQFYTGKQGFKGPVDLGMNGNFGFHGGTNWGLPLLQRYGIGYQIGANYIGSDFAGRTGPLGHRRAQLFATTGVFRRATGGKGFQGGAVIDYLRDDFYIQQDLTQARVEMSYLCYYHEVGFWGAFVGNTDTNWGQVPNYPMEIFSYQATTQYNLFYRYEFANGTNARTWFGASSHGDAIFGGDATVRFSDRVGLMASYNYLLPRNDVTVPNNIKESWNVTFSFVWYPGYKRRDSWTNPYRPLFAPADNGWFFIRQANRIED